MPVSVFQTSFDVIRKRNSRYPEVLAVQLWTEPMKRNAFQKQRLKPRTYLFINLVHSFIALPLPIFCFLFFFYFYYYYFLNFRCFLFVV